jgi:hypothetical protein
MCCETAIYSTFKEDIMNNYMNQNQYSPVYQYMQPVQTMYPQSGTPVSPSAGMPPLPTGYPSGPAYASIPSQVQQANQPAPVSDTMGPAPETVESIAYTQGYLRKHIGERVKVEFLIGTNMLIDREGTLVDVGASYIVIQEAETDDLLLADMYSIKFVRFYY